MSSVINGNSASIIKHFRDKPAALSVYWIYCARQNNEGVAWPSLRGLSHDTGWSIDTVKEAREWLTEHGALERIETYVRPVWRTATSDQRPAFVALDHAQYYRVTGALKIDGKSYPLLYENAVQGDSEGQSDESHNDVLPGRTSEPSNIETPPTELTTNKSSQLDSREQEEQLSSPKEQEMIAPPPVEGEMVKPDAVESSEPTPFQALFAAVCAEFGYDPAKLTKDKRGLINRVAGELLTAGCTIPEVHYLKLYLDVLKREQQWTSYSVAAMTKYYPDYAAAQAEYNRTHPARVSEPPSGKLFELEAQLVRFAIDSGNADLVPMIRRAARGITPDLETLGAKSNG